MRILRSIIIALIVSAGAFGVVAMGNYKDNVNAADCSSNAVIKCGVDSITRLRTAYAQNTGNTKAIFSYFGISSSMVNQGKYGIGSATKDGKIVVNGKVVATNGVSAGRNPSNGATKINLSGTTFYTRPIGSLFVTPTEPVIVFYNADGSVSHAVMNSCGNPIKATPVEQPKPTPAPSYACDSLTPTKISRTEYQFDTKASAAGGAKVVSYTYNFGDGTAPVADPATTKHTYAKPGTYKVSVVVTVNTGQNITKTVSCETTVTVAQEMCPIEGKTQYPKDSDKCIADKPSVTIIKVVNSKKSDVVEPGKAFTYTLTVKNTGNVALKDAVVSDAQPNGITFTQANIGSIANGTWSAKTTLNPGESKLVTVTAKLATRTDKELVNKACVDATEIKTSPDACDTASVTTPKDNEIVVCVVATKTEKTIKESEFVSGKMVKGANAPECQPSTPVVVEETPKTPTPEPTKPETVTETPTTVVSTTPTPQPESTPAPTQSVTELPKTGTIDVLGGSLGLGSLAGAGYYYVDSRRKLANLFKN